MKINKIDCAHNKSFTNNFSQMHSNNPDGHYMYYRNIGFLPAFKDHKREYIAGIFASIVAMAALSTFIVKKSAPKDIVEVASKTLGLNKSGVNQEFAQEAKEKILYPVMAVKSGQWRKLLRENFANGMIIAGKDAEFNSQAFMEHAEELGIECFRLDPNINGRQNVISGIYRLIEDAENATKFNRVNCVIIDIGNIDKAITLSKAKSNIKDVSKIENKLTSLPNGIIWSGWTTNSEKIPYYYNNTPTHFFMLP